jgi:hypothetical protein
MDAFESLLEKEYMLLLDFDERVERFETQPITIPVPGVAKGYTPDVLVHYLADPLTGEKRKPLLTEIKHTDDLNRNADKYIPKFEAAKQYARECGWEFHVTTQNEIRTSRLANIKFLREYRNIEPASGDLSKIVQLVEEAGGSLSPNAILGQLIKYDDDRLHWLPVIWHAVLSRQLTIDWDQHLGHDSILQLPDGA